MKGDADPDPVASTVKSASAAVIVVLRDQPVFSATLLAFAFLLVRVIRVSSFDLPTAVGITKAGGLSTVIVGTVVSCLPQLMIAAIAMIVAFGPNTTRLNMVVLILLGLEVLITPLFWATLYGAFVAAIKLLNRAIDRDLDSQSRQPLRPFAPTSLLRRYGKVVFIGFPVFILLVRPEFWLPPEELSRSGDEPVVGYVLDDTAGWITVLTDKERTLVRLKSDTIEGRRVCSLPSSVDNLGLFGTSLGQLLVGTHQPVDCYG